VLMRCLATLGTFVSVSNQFLWCLESKLIKSDDLTTGGQDAGAGSLSDAEGTELELFLSRVDICFFELFEMLNYECDNSVNNNI